MDRLSYKGKVFTSYEYSKESDFELDIIKHAKEIFGKRKIGVRLHKFTKYKKEWLLDQIEYRNLENVKL